MVEDERKMSKIMKGMKKRYERRVVEKEEIEGMIKKDE